MLTSGAAVEVLNAPAGTGKSFLVGALADTWPPTGRPQPARRGAGRAPTARCRSPPAPSDGPRVFGVAYGQRQADVLAEEGVTARNIRRWLDGQARLDAGRGTRRRRGVAAAPRGPAGGRRGRRRPHPDLVAIQRRCAQAGAKLLLVGDTRQLAAVGAGGALADIAERGMTYELAEVRRFTEGGRGRRRCGCATATRAWSTSTPNTAGSSTPAPSSRPNRPAGAGVAGRHDRRPRRPARGRHQHRRRPRLHPAARRAGPPRPRPGPGVPLGHARLGGHRGRGRGPGAGPPQRLAPRRLGGQHRGPDQPPDLPRHRHPPRRRP